ncbi:MAG TPA: SDR family oxidoreductase [Gammaproteobacteria bacterium]|nr:SDR family oxidoreductase [Gammaproteobacteria bacterium]
MNDNRKVAIVTGSSSGVGAATARALAAKGWCVTINYSRSAEAAKQVAADCQRLGGDTLLVQADVADDADCRRLVEETLERWGRLDALVNNAGTTKFCDHANLAGLDKQDFLDLYAVNTIGPFQMTRAAEQALRASGGGAIVNVASIAGLAGVGSSIAYAASKGALITMTKSLARVLGPQVRINAVCPGFIQGEWLRQGLGSDVYDARKQALEKVSPLRLTATAEQVAEGILFFIEGPSITTGETLLLDGGAHLGPR